MNGLEDMERYMERLLAAFEPRLLKAVDEVNERIKRDRGVRE